MTERIFHSAEEVFDYYMPNANKTEEEKYREEIVADMDNLIRAFIKTIKEEE